MGPLQVEVIPLRIPAEKAEVGGLGEHYECAVLVLRQDGYWGLGEAPALAARNGILGEICAELESGRPRHPSACSAWTTAELDLEARRRSMPAAALLGGVRRDRVRCNALIHAYSPVTVGRQAETAAAAGFEVVKLKGAAMPLDLERLGAARWALGTAARLRLDAGGRDYRSGLPALAAFDPELLEQPLPATASPAEWRAASAVCPVLAADESLLEPGQRVELAEAGVGLACKLATVGGPQAVMALAARATGPVLVSSSYETSVGIAAAVAVACALTKTPLACGLATRHLLAGDIAEGLGPEGAELALPAGPGLGVELDEKALARYRLDR
jgi:L-alanine-DL-glutamate epimerase-like enolase superfamily enzyme